MNFRDESGPPENGQQTDPASQKEAAPQFNQQAVEKATLPQPVASPPEAIAPQAKAKLPKVSPRVPKLSPKFFKQYGAVIAVVVVLVLGLGLVQHQRTAESNKWKKISDYHSRAEYQKAAALLKDTDPPKDKDQLIVYSQTMLATRQLDRALIGYQALYDTNKDAATKLIIGNIYNEQKKYKDAESVYQEVVAANKSNVQAYVNLATLYKLQGKNKDAVLLSKQAVQANPGSVVLQELQVSMLLDDKNNPDYKTAVEALKKLNPQDPLLEAIKQN